MVKLLLQYLAHKAAKQIIAAVPHLGLNPNDPGAGYGAITFVPRDFLELRFYQTGYILAAQTLVACAHIIEFAAPILMPEIP
jgi:hypothetical protein